MPPAMIRGIALTCSALCYIAASASFGQTPFPNGTLVKGSGDEVDVIVDGQRKWVPDPATLEVFFGVNPWQLVHKIPDNELNAIPKGSQLPSEVKPGALFKSVNADEIYLINPLGARSWIPDPATFYDYDFTFGNVKGISQGAVDAIPLGAPLPHSARFEFSLSGPLPGTVSRIMETSGNFSSKTRLLTATTHTESTMALAGFKGGVAVVFVDDHGLILGQDFREFGVDGRLIGRSNRVEPWQDSIDVGIADHTATVYVVHGPDPQGIQAAVQSAMGIAQPIGDAIAAWASKFVSSSPAQPKVPGK